MFQTTMRRLMINLNVQREIFRVSSRALSNGGNPSNFESDHLFSYSEQEGFIRYSPYPEVKQPNVLLHEFVWENMQNCQNKVAFECGETGRSFTYSKLRDSCAALAIRLQNQLGLKRSDVIAVCLPNVPEFPIAMFGGLEAGLVITTVNPIYTADEISKQLQLSGAKAIIGLASCHDVLKEACNLAQQPMKIICLKTDPNQSIPSGAINFAELFDPTGIDYNQLRLYDMSPNDVCILPFSSGTTGLPKGVMLTHNTLGTNSRQIQTPLPNEPLIRPAVGESQERLVSVLPFFHIYGMNACLVTATRTGSKTVTFTQFKPEPYVKAIAEHKATVIHVVPPIVLFLTNSEAVKAEQLKTLRSMMSGAAPIGTLDVERFLRKCPTVGFLQGYGLTEASPVVLVQYSGIGNYSSVGAPTPCTEAKIIKVDDPLAIGLGPNEKGELLVRGPQVMKGYLNNEAATKEMLLNGGWLKTGDCGYYDERGLFFITDRLKELIKVKGFQVPPAELEEIVRDIDGVMDAAVVGAPHPNKGEVPRAFVVRKPDSEITEQQIKDFVAAKVAKYKKLEGGVIFLETIPKNASGKILRRQLKEKYC